MGYYSYYDPLRDRRLIEKRSNNSVKRTRTSWTSRLTNFSCIELGKYSKHFFISLFTLSVNCANFVTAFRLKKHVPVPYMFLLNILIDETNVCYMTAISSQHGWPDSIGGDVRVAPWHHFRFHQRNEALQK